VKESQNVLKDHQTRDNLYPNKFANLYEMDKFIEQYNLPKPTQNQMENLNSLTLIKKKTPNLKPFTNKFQVQHGVFSPQILK
jgi:hypothetical protein